MRVTAIEGRELFSFDVLRLGELPSTLVVVGPNGAGETNLLRLVDVIRAALERAATYSQESYRQLMRFAAARRYGAAPGNLSGVRIGVALTEPWERQLLGSYVRAAVSASLLQGTPANSDTGELIARIRIQLDEDELEPLSSGAIIAELTDAVAGQWSVAYEFNAGGRRFHWVINGPSGSGRLVDAADAARSDVPAYPITRKIDIDEQRVPKQPLTLAALLPEPGEASTLTLDQGQQWAELTREFAQLAGMPLDDVSRGYSLAHVLREVVARELVLLGDLRQPPLSSYSADDLAQDLAPADGSRIPVLLFRLKNGNAAARMRYAEIQDLFRRLTGLTFDLSLSLSPEDRDQNRSTVQISVVLPQTGQDLPIEFAGAGLWEALLLSATLPESAGLVAMLDEPARNLHPTLQRRLLTEIRAAAGQFITTHSPYLVPVEAGASPPGIIRLETSHAPTRARRLWLDGTGSAQLRKALTESADARALLFTRGVILVEGGTELGALPEWFTKSRTAARVADPDVLNLAVYSVDGDRSFETCVSLLHSLGIAWTQVCDGFIYRFGQPAKQIFQQVLGAGVDNASLQAAVAKAAAGGKQSFSDLKSVGETSGIFTLAAGSDASDESFEAYIQTVSPGSLTEAASAVVRSKPRQGRYIAEKIDCPPEVDALYAKILRQLSLL
ncbi:MAG TPA: AAA family ATPase [Streptosporangiaceae bacterium]|nr:AAA family ATPase [Streptosporangiaceae bacterium]